MSLASILPSTSNAGTYSVSHYPNTSLFKLNSTPKFTYKSWRPKPSSSTIFHISCSNTKFKTTPKNPSTADLLKPFAQTSLEPTPSANDGHDLNQGLSQSKSKSMNPSKPTASVLTRQRPRHSRNRTWSPKIAALRAFARKLDLCEPTKEAIFEALDSFEETLNPKDAMVVMNNINGWEKAYYFFQWLNKNDDFQMDDVTYSVTMKVLRRGKQWNRVEELLQNMLDQGFVPSNITCSIVISCAILCKVPHKAVKWFERMEKAGIVPDEVTCTAMIDAYTRAGKVQEALHLYERARADGWHPDVKAFATVLNVYDVSGDFDGALKIFQEMKALGVKPNLVAYNIMFRILAKVGKPLVARTLFKEMTGAGLYPNKETLTSLLRVYSKSRWVVDCLKLSDKMKEEGWSKNLFLYNTLLRMCADVRHVEEAVMLFKEMQQSDNCKPDSWSYASMITLYTRGDQIEEANRMFSEMKEAGFRPDVMVYTSLIKCYGRAKRFDDFVKTFNLFLDEGIIPDDKFCSSLLWILTFCENEEISKVLECIEKVNPKLGLVVKMLQEEDIDIAVLQEKLRTVFKQASNEVQRSVCSSLIDLCYNFNCRERARDLLYLGTQFGLYKNLHTKSPAQWCLDLRSLSFKAAVIAFDDWISSLSKALKAGEEMPQSLGIQTGRGSHKYRPDQAFVDLFGSHLRELEFPFEKRTERFVWFFTTRDAVISWLQSRSS